MSMHCRFETLAFFISRCLSMKTPIFRTHREAVIVETPTRITLPSTSAAADLGAIRRYCVLASFIKILCLGVIHKH